MKPALPLFLYVEGALDAEAVRRVRAAGYQPVKVQSFDGVRQLDSISLARLDVINKAAMETIAGCTPLSSAIPESFGRRVAKALSSQ